MMKRIGLWAFAGFGVAVVWAFIAATIGPHYNLGQSALVALTVPLSWIGHRVPMTYYEVILMNAATYALIGLITEPLWHRHR